MDSTTAPPSSACSPGEPDPGGAVHLGSVRGKDLSPQVAALVGRLQSRSERPAVARELAQALGAEDLLIFTRDPELGVMLPALGFPQVLPRGRAWPEFLVRCMAQMSCEAELPVPGGSHEPSTGGAADSVKRVRVKGCAAGRESLVVLVGGEPDWEHLATFCSLLPIISAAFQGEMAEMRATGHAAVAREAAQRAEALAQALDTSRRNLESALREAREADRRKDEFLAMLAHELRNPLAPVLNAIQVLAARGSDDPLLRRHRAVIDRQARHMARLLDDLLDVSRITRGKIELRKQPLDFSASVDHAVEAVRPLLEQRQHHLDFSIAPEPLYVSADPTRLHQVIGNLLNNAAKYTEPGGRICLTVSRAGDQAVLRVRDSGVGMAPGFLPRVFDLFTQADRSDSRTESGLGIGLTMVQRLVQLHGGTVEVHSEGLGKGSEFTVRLPLITAGAPPASTGAPAPAAAGGSLPRRILVVDDNQDAAETLAELAGLWGHEVRAVHDGQAALGAAEEFRPEIVLLDISMPGMNGYEVAAALRQRTELRGITLIALTGYGQEEDRRRTQEAGFHHHLTKPVDPDRLRELLSLG